MEENIKKVWEAELGTLRGVGSNEFPEVSQFLELLHRGEYEKIIEKEVLKEMLMVSGEFSCQVDKPLDFLKSLVNSYLKKHDSIISHFEVLCLGIACLNAFIQSNWTGPEFKCPSVLMDSLKLPGRKCFPEESRYNDIHECICAILSVDGEEINATIINPELLLVALIVFGSDLSGLRTPDWWLLRSTYILQQILDEQSPTLLDQLSSLANKVVSLDWIAESKYLQVLSCLEVARIYLHFGKIDPSDREIKKALSILKMDISLTGAMGKRTYYQTRDIAQIMINVKVVREAVTENGICSEEIDFPKDVSLNDEIRMPYVSFNNPQDGVFPDLLPLEQATLLAVLVFKKKSQAKDQLQNEELLPFVSCLLSHPKVWPFHLSTLHLRSRMECEHKRTLERALLQTQTLMELNNNKTPVSQRLILFYCSYAPPSFIIASECASILFSIGSIQSALDIYLQLQMWDEVITCYNFLKLRHKAAEVINEQLKKGETVKLLCSLGDATDDISCYERAWDLSNQRSAQAQRHWGMYYFNKRMYRESIDHFNLSLSKNSLQIAIWFRLGYANLMEHRWEESASAYQRYCALEPGSYEAWNNMAKAYIHLGQKDRAYHALKDAIKCNYESWQLWDNLMAVSSDCGEFEEVIYCYHRILDLKDKHIDEQILGVLTTVIAKNVKDCRGQPASRYCKKALELFGRITSKVMGNSTIWQLYAQLTAAIDDQTSITRSKVIQYYQKAYTAATQDNSWFKDFESMQKVLKISEKLGEAHLTFIKDVSPSEAIQSLSSAKFSLANVLAKVNEQLKIMDTTNMDISISSDVKTLTSISETVQEEIIRLKNC